MNLRLCFLVLLLALALPAIAQQTLNLMQPSTACSIVQYGGQLTCGWENTSTGCYETLNEGFLIPPYMYCAFANQGPYKPFAEAEYYTFRGCGSGCQKLVYDLQCNLTFQMTSGGPGVC